MPTSLSSCRYDVSHGRASRCWHKQLRIMSEHRVLSINVLKLCWHLKIEWAQIIVNHDINLSSSWNNDYVRFWIMACSKLSFILLLFFRNVLSIFHLPASMTTQLSTFSFSRFVQNMFQNKSVDTAHKRWSRFWNLDNRW